MEEWEHCNASGFVYLTRYMENCPLENCPAEDCPATLTLTQTLILIQGGFAGEKSSRKGEGGNFTGQFSSHDLAQYFSNKINAETHIVLWNK